VWPSAIVVVNPQLKGAPEMPLSQRDKKVQTLPTNSAHEAITRRNRQRRPQGGSQNPDAEVSHCLVQLLRKDAFPIVDYLEISILVMIQSICGPQVVVSPIRDSAIWTGVCGFTQDLRREYALLPDDPRLRRRVLGAARRVCEIDEE
jgi:hypothetical protein